MVIIIGNQKGGAGKSTLAKLLANYLTQVKGYEVAVLDMDYQRSIFQQFEKAKILENTEPYEVLEAELEYFPSMLKILSSNKKRIILIDLPGKLDDDGLLPVFKGAQLVITPYAYDEQTYNSTVLFALVVKRVNPESKIVFIPNRIKANVKYDTQQEVDAELIKLGEITASIPDKIDFSRTTTFSTPLSLYSSITPIFEGIIDEYIKPVMGEGKEVKNEQ